MRRLHLLLNEPSSSRAAGIIAYFVITAIMLSTVTLCLETMPSYYQSVSSALSTWFFLEAACISIFTLELASSRCLFVCLLTAFIRRPLLAGSTGAAPEGHDGS